MMERIENQRQIPRHQWRYGFRASADTGCGWIAVYNALALLGYRCSPEALIRMMERLFPLVHGNLGTTLPAPGLCFQAWGFPVKWSFRRREFDAMVDSGDVCILFFHWHRGKCWGNHFITLQQGPEGILGHNVYANSVGPEHLGQSLSRWMESKGYFGGVLMQIESQRRKP